MQSIGRGIAAMILVAPLAACSGDAWITGGELIRPGEPTGTLEIINGTSVSLDVITMSDCNVSTYGFNRLPEGNYIPPGGSYQFTVSAGCWDVAGGALGVGDASHRMDVAAGGIAQYTITD